MHKNHRHHHRRQSHQRLLFARDAIRNELGFVLHGAFSVLFVAAAAA